MPIPLYQRHPAERPPSFSLGIMQAIEKIMVIHLSKNQKRL
jgi:hypothetical protein